MSPSENDLRAALRDGEGEPLDVDHVLARGRAARTRRRARALNTAAAVAVVAGLATGGTLLANSETSGSNSGASPGGAKAAGGASFGSASGTSPKVGSSAQDYGSGGAARRPSPSGQVAIAGGTSASPACPTSLPRAVLPGSSADVQPGGRAAVPLFSAPPQSLVVCAYGSLAVALGTSAPAPRRLVLTGRDATTVADSLEKASPTKPTGMCPQWRRADEQALAIIGVGGDGARVGTVTTTVNRPPCSVVVSNGHTQRYGWTPPSALSAPLSKLAAPGKVVPSARPS